MCAPRTPGPLGVGDQADPSRSSLAGETPGPTGLQDHGALLYTGSAPQFGHTATGVAAGSADGGDLSEDPLSGSVAVGTGMAAVVRIPVPGTGGLFIELTPRGWTPQGGSTSTLFIQDATGRRNLRLDYGYNVRTGTVDYHWNQKGTHGQFGIPDHSPAGSGGRAAYQAARYFRYAGRVLLVLGAAADAYSIVVAEKRMRQVAKVAAGWLGAWGGCKVVGAGGAVGGSLAPGLGTAAGGVAGCIVGGVGGYWGASYAAGELYDWVEETFFIPLPEVAGPD